MSDPSGGVPRRVPRNEPGQIAGGLAIVLSVVAVVIGFVVLRSISGSGEYVRSPTESVDVAATTTVAEEPVGAVTTTVAAAPTTTEPALVTEGASVIVANANSVNGSAGSMTDQLASAGYNMGAATNASASIGRLDETVVYYDPGIPSAQAVAESVAASLGGVTSIAPVATPAPTQTGSMDGAGVLVLLGLDKAGRSLAELVPTTVATVPAGATATTVAG
ncbi:MAG: LytR C-terminal domain-containing protein [Actinomycetota bacterium]|nr:LytR C-terminal domain-containing protein [Ilumatobacteraceae bacterium]MDA2959672.1 LytR C-terminal domain-containing protein [Actinomycetota bacterium]MDA3007483.1 LytR C-terminal domain-containing protein [Actinomycetota bacterium]MDA3034578.1 LytR C-terminal domain-containing protein [Actinomycetota bacterium]